MACPWLCALCSSVVKEIVFLYFFSVPLDTGILRDVTLVLLVTVHSAGDTIVFVVNGFY